MAADPPIAGVVLAAGRSRRMGRNKLLLELGGEPLVRRAARAAIEAGLQPVVVVVGHEAERTAAALEGLACAPVAAAGYEEGMHRSLRAGLRALPSGVAGAVVSLGDMPLVTAAMLRAVGAALLRSGAPLALSLYGAVAAPPIAYAPSLFAELCDGEGDGVGRRVIARHRGEAAEVRWPEAALADLDLPDDLERAQALLAQGAPR